jgi:hypothetical protein
VSGRAHDKEHYVETSKSFGKVVDARAGHALERLAVFFSASLRGHSGIFLSILGRRAAGRALFMRRGEPAGPTTKRNCATICIEFEGTARGSASGKSVEV